MLNILKHELSRMNMNYSKIKCKKDYVNRKWQDKCALRNVWLGLAVKYIKIANA